MLDGGVNAIHIVDDVKPASAARVALPISNVLPITTPAEAIATIKLFFIHPVKGSVHNGVVAIRRNSLVALCRQILYVKVVLAHVCHLAAIGRKLGKHQTTLWQPLA